MIACGDSREGRNGVRKKGGSEFLQLVSIFSLGARLASLLAPSAEIRRRSWTK